jgi:hypothetical protein
LDEAPIIATVFMSPFEHGGGRFALRRHGGFPDVY